MDNNQTNEEKIVLTLNAEVPATEEKVSSEELKEVAEKVTPEQLEKAKLDDSNLSDEEKQMVEDFSKQINIMETNTVLQYGSAAQNKISDFSESVIKNVKSKDIDDVGNMLAELVTQLKGFDIDKEENGIMKFFKKTSNKVLGIKERYDKAAQNVDDIVKALEKHQITLMKDISILDQLYEKNLVNFKELTMYILAGYKHLEEVKATELPALLKKAEETGLPEDAQAANDLSNAINRFEKKLHDLELTRMVAIQMAPQIRLVQNNDTMMTEKIQSTLANTIPLWKSQMLIALGLAHSQEAIKAQNAVSEMTNKMLKENAENLKQATIKTAQESERGVVDIETLTETNKKLIETLEEVKRIQEEGREHRAAAQVELRRIENELQEKLTDIQKS